MGIPYEPPPQPLTPAQIKQKIKQQKKTFNWIYSQATNGDVTMQCDLGEHYLSGNGTKTNRDLGIKWLQKAANQGDIEASNELMKLNESTNNISN